MRSNVLSIHCGLAEGTRLPLGASQSGQLSAADVLLLLAAGSVAAAATGLLDFGLRIPGHAILRAVFPMALGLALAPRRMGGMVMGAGALGSAVTLHVGGAAAIGLGAMTSLVLIGPLLDLALWRAKRGWQLYLAFALAGLGGNLAALAVRGGTKAVGLGRVARPFAAWWFPAVITYPFCGLLAGLISALVLFRLFGAQGNNARGELPS